MRNLRFLAILAAAAVLAATATAADARKPLIGPELRAMVAGGTFRGFAKTMRGFENHIWRFAPDGTVTTVFDIRRQVGRRGDHHIEGSAAGTWSIQGDRLCVQWQPMLYLESDCYGLAIDENVSVTEGHYIHLLGRDNWQGTLQR